MASDGPPDDLYEQRTQYADYGAGGRSPWAGPPPADASPTEVPPDRQQPPASLEPLDRETGSTPWYRKPAGLIGWIIAVSLLIGLIVYGIMELIGGGEGTSTPSTSTTPMTTITTTTESPPAATTTEPTTTPPTSSAAEPPAQQPTQEPTREPTQQQPTHRHRLPPIPSVITIPGMPNPVTLPPGLP